MQEIKDIQPLLRFLSSKHKVRHREDFIQDINIRIYNNRHKLKPQTIKNWVYTVARNKAIDLWRVEQRQATVELTENKRTTQPETNIDKDVFSRLEGIPNIHLIRMSYDGWLYKDIAKELNLTEQTVKSKIFKARRDIKKKFTRKMLIG